MEQTNLTVIGFEDTVSKSGKGYTKFKTSDGTYNVFEDQEEIISQLKATQGQLVSVTTATSTDGKFKNIRAFLGAGMKENTKPVITEQKISPLKPEKKNGFNITPMYVSYAKDIYVAILETKVDLSHEAIMDISIEMVERAKKAFS